jgi:hypothetical protein
MADTSPNRLDRWKDIASLTQSVVTIAAVLAAGLWFLLRDAVYHRLDLSQTVDVRPLAENAMWLHVTLKAKNAGESKVYIGDSIVRIQRILPLDRDIAEAIAANRAETKYSPQHEMLWHKIAEDARVPQQVTIPSGSTETLEFDFVIPSAEQMIRVYSYLPDTSENDSGWSASTIVDLRKVGKE